ncbi:MAG: hypothetical protein COA49_03180 [Bacteroidetes bacterium]|nr:MAG: hypothetical protein COA49_03180 [Bacteroidota bacterium]
MDLKYTRGLLPGMFLDYDCVIVPGLGGFVCNERSAWYDADKAEMVPPSRDVLFSPNLTHNDGLLAQEIMRATECSYSDAMSIVNSESAMMVEDLSNGIPVELPRVGRLYKGEDGVIRFLPDAEIVRTLSSFGHSRIPLSLLKQNVVEPSVSATPTPRVIQISEKIENQQFSNAIPLRVKIARVAAVIAIPAMLGGAWMLTDTTPSTTLMSVLPSFSPSTGSLLYDTDDNNKEEELVINYSSDDLEVVRTEDSKPADESTVDITLETLEAKADQPLKEINFLIVGGAFSVKENALSLVATLKEEGYTPTLHFQKHNKLHLVALSEHETEQSARRGLSKARKSGRKATWLKKM